MGLYDRDYMRVDRPSVARMRRPRPAPAPHSPHDSRPAHRNAGSNRIRPARFVLPITLVALAASVTALAHMRIQGTQVLSHVRWTQRDMEWERSYVALTHLLYHSSWLALGLFGVVIAILPYKLHSWSRFYLGRTTLFLGGLTAAAAYLGVTALQQSWPSFGLWPYMAFVMGLATWAQSVAIVLRLGCLAGAIYFATGLPDALLATHGPAFAAVYMTGFGTALWARIRNRVPLTF